MAGSIVQSKAAYADATATTIASGALTANPTNGNFLWVVVKCQNLGTTVTVADSRGLTWTDQGGVTEAGTGQHLHHFTAPVTGAGACDVTATFGTTQIQRGIAVFEVGGVSAVQGTVEQQDAGANPTVSGSVTVTTQPAYGLIAGNDLQGNQFTAGTGWALVGGSLWTAQGGAALFVEETHITATGAVAGNFVNPAWDRVTLVMVVFTESAGGTPATVAGPGLGGASSVSGKGTGAARAGAQLAATSSASAAARGQAAAGAQLSATSALSAAGRGAALAGAALPASTSVSASASGQALAGSQAPGFALQSWLVAYWGDPTVPLPENVPPQANLTLAPSEPLQLALVADSTAAVAVQYAPTQTALPLAVVSPSLQLQALRVDASLHP